MKTGLPCQHIIKILIVLNQPLSRQIDEYWIFSSKYQRIKKYERLEKLGRW